MRLVTRSAMKTRPLRAHIGMGAPAQDRTVLIRLALLWCRVVDRYYYGEGEHEGAIWLV